MHHRDGQVPLLRRHPGNQILTDTGWLLGYLHFSV